MAFKIDRRLQTITNGHLALADFSIGLVSMPLFSVYLLLGRRWPLGAVACDLWLSVDYTMSNASVANLFWSSVSIGFCRSRGRSCTYRAQRTPRRAALAIAVAWVVSLVLWPPWIVSWPHLVGERTVPECDCYIQFLISLILR